MARGHAMNGHVPLCLSGDVPVCLYLCPHHGMALVPRHGTGLWHRGMEASEGVMGHGARGRGSMCMEVTGPADGLNGHVVCLSAPMLG